MPLWLTALTALAGWTAAATALGLVLARHIHRTPPQTSLRTPRTVLRHGALPAESDHLAGYGYGYGYGYGSEAESRMSSGRLAIPRPMPPLPHR